MRAILRVQAAACLASLAASAAMVPCRIEVVEKGSGWPVPMVELRTTHHVRFVSDNAGLIAFDLPESMGRETWFDVVGYGYEVPKDGFGSRGVRFTPKPGERVKVEVTRTIIARRMGRLTGAGIFAESQKMGLENDWRESGIVGADSVQNAVYRGKLYWAWGDTAVPGYPLGIFDMTSATTPVSPLASLEPPLRVHFDYFTGENGRPRAVAKMPGSGPTWISGYVVLPDKTGATRLLGTYQKIRNHLECYEAGQSVWDDQSQTFKLLRVIWTKSEKTPKLPVLPEGHPIFWSDEQGKQWVLFGNPLPYLRCPATFEAWQDEKTWEKLTPQRSLSAADGATVRPHSGSVAWNSWRKRWVTVFMENSGKSFAMAELWYAEAPSPVATWGTAVKVLSHPHYTFYNPRLHPECTPEGSPILFFEATHTAEFSDNKEPTPRYNYNQLLYRLDLDEPALSVAQGKAKLQPDSR